MKTLYLVRHAKASQSMLTLADIDRPLVERGYSDAHAMSKKLASGDFNPGIIVTSPGIRALTTALIFARNLRFPASGIQLMESLYNAPVENLMNAILSFDNAFDTAMLFGHNPSVTNLVSLVSDKYLENIPTAGYCGISFQVSSWASIGRRSGKVFLFEFPKNG